VALFVADLVCRHRPPSDFAEISDLFDDVTLYAGHDPLDLGPGSLRQFNKIRRGRGGVTLRRLTEDEAWSGWQTAADVSAFIRQIEAKAGHLPDRVVVLWAKGLTPEQRRHADDLRSGLEGVHERTGVELGLWLVGPAADLPTDGIRDFVEGTGPACAAPETVAPEADSAVPADAPGVEPEGNTLTRLDRCDVPDCGAQAFVRATLASGPLLFCGHHWRESEAKVAPLAVAIRDER
jgi:hypothetical protein